MKPPKVDNPRCTFCKNDEETLFHLFCECEQLLDMAASYMHDRDVVIRIIKRYTELIFSEEHLKRLDKDINPQNTDASKIMATLGNILSELEMRAVKESGVEVEGPSQYFLGNIRHIYKDDAEIQTLLAAFSAHGAKSMAGTNQVGDCAPDVSLVSMETKDISLASFQSELKPLVVLSSSFS
ncbi:uncharacterized protein LOC144448667 [Glandiceps talaboti]